MKYIRAIRGKHKVHIKYPRIKNDISWCRYCTQFEPATEEEFLENPCSRCKQLLEMREKKDGEIQSRI